MPILRIHDRHSMLTYELILHAAEIIIWLQTYTYLFFRPPKGAQRFQGYHVSKPPRLHRSTICRVLAVVYISEHIRIVHDKGLYSTSHVV
jgi:hypothetical protein